MTYFKYVANYNHLGYIYLRTLHSTLDFQLQNMKFIHLVNAAKIKYFLIDREIQFNL